MQIAIPTLDQKIADILVRVRSAFIEKGFDGASMQDLARAAGMSVGNFYRYFPSKSAIVEQLIAYDLDEMQAEFAQVIKSDHPMQALRASIRHHVHLHQTNTDGQLWAEIQAVSMRKPEISSACCHMETTIIGHLLAVFAAETGLTLAQSQRRFSTQAAFIVMLVQSAAMVAPHNGLNLADLTDLILQTIDKTLDDVASVGVKG